MSGEDVQFYNQCLSAVKRLKSDNDKINNSIGLEENDRIVEKAWEVNNEMEHIMR